MDDLLPLFVGIAALAGVLGSIAIWTPRKVWLKCAALCTVSFFLPVAYFALAGLLSLPKPADMEWLHRQMAQATVLGTRLEEGEAIYLWLELEGVPEPRAYVLPWDQKLAQQIHGAKREAEEKGSKLLMGKPFQSSQDNREKKFYTAPQPALPPKQPAGAQPLEFENQSSRDTMHGDPEGAIVSRPPFLTPTRSRAR